MAFGILGTVSTFFGGIWWVTAERGVCNYRAAPSFIMASTDIKREVIDHLFTIINKGSRIELNSLNDVP